LDDKRLFIFFAISLAILVTWQLLVPAPPPPERPAEVPAASVAGEEAPAVAAPAAAPVPAEGAEGAAEGAEGPAAEEPSPVEAPMQRVVVVEGDGYRAELTNRGAQLLSFRLREHEDAEGEPLELVRRRPGGPYPLALLGPDLEPLPLDQALFAVERSRGEGGAEVVDMRYHGPLGTASKRLVFHDDGRVELAVRAAATGWGLLLGPGVRNPPGEEIGGRFSTQQVVYLAGGEVETLKAVKAERAVRLPGSGLGWVGLEDTHFLTVLVPQAGVADVLVQPVVVEAPEEPGGAYAMRPFDDEEGLDAAAEDLPRDLRLVVFASGEELAASAYFGPKAYEHLAALPWGLERTVEWGVWGFLARPLLFGLEWIHANVVANYGWAIVLMTILLKILLFPLTHKSYVSMQKMQKLQPRMQAIRQKYRGKMRDKKGRLDLEMQRRQNEEIQEIFRSEGASPMGGCLPMLLQIPVFFAFFRLLLTAVELRREPWLGWIEDLSRPDPLYILPVLMGLTQIYQQRLTPAASDPMQRRIMQLFPWIFTIFSLSFPSGLVLYWTVNNVFTIGQTVAYQQWKARRESAEDAARPARRRRKQA
jgi:YidC/Oxa1 family membrane protein insertase